MIKKTLIILMMLSLVGVVDALTPEQCASIDIQNVDAQEIIFQRYTDNGTLLNINMNYRTLNFTSNGSCEIIYKNMTMWRKSVVWINHNWKYPKIKQYANETLNTTFLYMRDLKPVWQTMNQSQKDYVINKFNTWFNNKIGGIGTIRASRNIKSERDRLQIIQDRFNDIPIPMS